MKEGKQASEREFHGDSEPSSGKCFNFGKHVVVEDVFGRIIKHLMCVRTGMCRSFFEGDVKSSRLFRSQVVF